MTGLIHPAPVRSLNANRIPSASRVAGDDAGVGTGVNLFSDTVQVASLDKLQHGKAINTGAGSSQIAADSVVFRPAVSR